MNELVLPFGNYLGVKPATFLPGAPEDADPKLMITVIATYPEGGDSNLIAFSRRLEHVFDFLWKTPSRDDLHDWIKETPAIAEEKQKIIHMLRTRQLMTFYRVNQSMPIETAQQLIVSKVGKPSKTVEKGTVGLLAHIPENTGVLLSDAAEMYASDSNQHINVGLNAIARDLPNLVKNKILALNTAGTH